MVDRKINSEKIDVQVQEYAVNRNEELGPN